jgi:hypothetical protein
MIQFRLGAESPGQANCIHRTQITFPGHLASMLQACPRRQIGVALRSFALKSVTSSSDGRKQSFPKVSDDPETAKQRIRGMSRNIQKPEPDLGSSSG